MILRTTLLKLLLLSQLATCFGQVWEEDEDGVVDTDLTALELAEEYALMNNPHAVSVDFPSHLPLLDRNDNDDNNYNRGLAATQCKEIVRNGHGMAKDPLQSWKPMRCRIVGGQTGPNKHLRSIKSFGRGSVHSGPSQDLDTTNVGVQACFQEGNHLIFSALMKVLRANGAPYACSTSQWNVAQTCPLFSLRMFFKDGTPAQWLNSWNKGLLGDPWRADRWNLYSTMFTVTKDLARAKQVYFVVRGPPAGTQILVSNVSIRPYLYPSATPTESPTSGSPTRPVPTRHPTTRPTIRDTQRPTIAIPTGAPFTVRPTLYTYVPPENLDTCDMEVHNGDFENGNADPSPWMVNEGGILSVVSPGYKSKHALKHAGRTAGNQGPKHPLNTDCFVTGRQIEISAKIRLVYNNPQRRLRLLEADDGDNATDTSGNNETATESEEEEEASANITTEVDDSMDATEANSTNTPEVENGGNQTSTNTTESVSIDTSEAEEGDSAINETNSSGDGVSNDTTTEVEEEDGTATEAGSMDATDTNSTETPEVDDTGNETTTNATESDSIDTLEAEENGYAGNETAPNNAATNSTDTSEAGEDDSTEDEVGTSSDDSSEEADTGDYEVHEICDPYGLGNCSCPLLTLHTFYEFGQEHTYSPNDSTMKWKLNSFNTFHTVITVTERMTLADKAFFYFERPPPGVSIIIDDVTVQEFQPIPIGNILVEGDVQETGSCDVIVANGDAEMRDTTGWTPRLGGHLSIRPEGADGTEYSFEHGARSSFIMGPRHVLKTNCFTQGMFYEFNAKIKLVDEDGKPFACDKTHAWIDDESCPLLTFQLIGADGKKTWEYFGNNDVRPWNSHTWNSFKSKFKITKEIFEASEAYFFIERPRAGVTIIIDQVEISRDCSTLISSIDAEDDSLLGWNVMNGAGGYLGIHPEGAGGSGHSFGHFGRITNGGGPGHNIDMGCLVNGTQYEFSLQMKLIDENDNNKFVACKKYLAWGDPDFCPLLSITTKQGSVDAAPVTKNYDSDDVSTWMADEWNSYHVVFTVDNYMAGMKEGFLTLKGVRAGIAILFDNVQLKVYEDATIERSCSSLVHNGDFEDGATTGWGRFNSGTIQIYPDGADGGSKSLLTVDRKLVGAGPEYHLDTSCLVEGKEYEFKAKLKLLSEDGQPFACVQDSGFKDPLTCPYISIHTTNDGAAHVKHHMDEIPTVWVATDWNEFSFVFTISHDLATASSAFIVFKGPAPGIGIIIDKVTLSPYSAPIADCDQLVTNTNAELGVLTGWTVHTGGIIGLYDGEGANGSDNSFIITERKDHQYGPLQYIPTECLVEGSQYDFYVHFKLLDEDGLPVACVKGAAWKSADVCPLITFDSQGSDGTLERTQAPNQYGAEWVADAFNEYHAIVTVTTAMAEADKVSFFFQGPPGGVNIMFDNVSMKSRDIAIGS